MHRLSRTVVATIVLAVIGALLPALPASATHIAGCYGTRQEHLPVKYGSTVVGYVDLYYSSANNGTNCVKTTSAGPSVGVAKFMIAKVYRCTGGAGSLCSDNTGGFDQRDEDKGRFQSFAGPVSVTGTSGRCVSFVGLVAWAGQELAAGSSPLAVHCG
jgi:hypothetical protein